MVPPLITLEEHFFSRAVLDSLDDTYSEQFKHVPGLAEKLRDLDKQRLQDMDGWFSCFVFICVVCFWLF